MDQAYLSANQAKPSPRQLRWQETEFYGLISYGMPVFTGKQYGDGFTPPSVFWPEDMNVDGWCETAKAAGMRGLVLTCKHYDGFCLWPSAHTEYSVKHSSWMNGEGDLVRLLSDACRRHHLKFGVHIAPWDRHEKSYGTGKAYDDYFCALLTELLTNYGDLFYVSLDGVCGAGETRTQQYDWGRYYQLIRSLQPDAVIAFQGPDVRWSGNDRGATRTEEWSPLPAGLGVYENGTSAPIRNKKNASLLSPDLGSRKAIKNETDFIWYPCEVAVPMRSEWFYNADDKYSMKTKDKLLKLYFNTVGNNSCLMLGLSPDKRGELDETDVKILKAFGKDLSLLFGGNILAASGDISEARLGKSGDIDNIRKTDGSFWKYAEKRPAEIMIRFDTEEMFDKIVLQENIADGQHIESFSVLYQNEKGKWKPLYKGSTVGYKRICPVQATQCAALKIVIDGFRDFFELKYLQIN